MGKMGNFGYSNKSYKYRDTRPSSTAVDNIDLPDFIPLEHAEQSSTARNQSFHGRRPNFKGNNRSSEDRFSNKSSSMERNNQSQITHESTRSNFQRPESPVLKIYARVGNLRTPYEKGGFSNNNNNKQHGFRYGNFSSNNSPPQKKHSPIIFDLDKPGNSSSSSHTSVQNSEQFNPRNSWSSSSFTDNEVATLTREESNHRDYSILRQLVRDKAQLVAHCGGLRDTIDQYYREISKLEALITQWSQEIDILKKRLLR